MRLAFTLAAAILFCVPAFCEEPERFRGTVERGRPFRHQVRGGLILGLDPTTVTQQGCDGWRLWIGSSETGKDLASLATGPVRGLSALDLCAADSRNSDNSGPNVPGPKNVNRPGQLRHFRYAVTRAENQRLAGALSDSDRFLELVRQTREGAFTITRLKLSRLIAGAQPTLEQMDFEVVLGAGLKGRSTQTRRARTPLPASRPVVPENGRSL